MKQVAKAYRKNVKNSTKTTGTRTVTGVKGQSSKTDNMMLSTMGDQYRNMKEGSSFSYTGPVKEKKRTIKGKLAPKSMTYGGSKKEGGRYVGTTKKKIGRGSL